MSQDEKKTEYYNAYYPINDMFWIVLRIGVMSRSEIPARTVADKFIAAWLRGDYRG